MKDWGGLKRFYFIFQMLLEAPLAADALFVNSTEANDYHWVRETVGAMAPLK
jgi:hypothetical protein